MNEKTEKKVCRTYSNCMWCDYFEDSECELGVPIKVIKSEVLSSASKEPHLTYGPEDKQQCRLKRKEKMNERFGTKKL